MNQEQIKEPLESPRGKLNLVRNLFLSGVSRVKKINFSKILEVINPVKKIISNWVNPIRNIISNGAGRGRQTKLGLIIMILIPVVIAASISIPLLLQKKGAEKQEAKPAAVFEKTGKLGDLEISILKAEENSYTAFEVIEGEAQRVQKKYYLVYARVFNPSNTEKITFSSVKLVDDLKNVYEQDIPILFDLRSSPQGFKEFGMDMVMYARVIREGNIVFPAVAENAKKLKLIFETETGEQAAFEFNK